MDRAGITILGSVQIDCAPMSVELSNLDGISLRQAHTCVHSEDVLREMFLEARLNHFPQLVKLLTTQEAGDGPSVLCVEGRAG